MEKSKGFIIVASKNRNFYLYAINLAESIRDYYEDCKSCYGVWLSHRMT